MLRDLMQLVSGGGVTGGAFFVAATIFQAWMFIDALRRREFVWAVLIFLFSVLTAAFYYFMVYRTAGAAGNPLTGFELPGAADRRQIKRLKEEIHHLDKAHLHQQLGDVYFNQGKLTDAEACYRAAYERDPKDEDVRAHFGTCLARQGKPQEALPLLRAVCAANPKHDYGYTLMTLAETQTAAGEVTEALATWRQVLAAYQYSRARVQYAELLLKTGAKEEAVRQLDEVINEAGYGPRFQRRREAVWVSRAKALRRAIP